MRILLKMDDMLGLEYEVMLKCQIRKITSQKRHFHAYNSEKSFIKPFLNFSSQLLRRKPRFSTGAKEVQNLHEHLNFDILLRGGEGLSSVTVSAKIPEELFKKIEKAIKERGYLNISDFIRDLIRREFKS